MKNKTLFQIVSGFVGSAIVFLFGGFDLHVQALLFCMITDFIIGIVGACIFHSSNKSDSGRLSSNALFKGLIKKCVCFLMVAVCYRIDLALGLNMLRKSAIIGFICGEVISIVENMGLMGIPIPNQIKKMIDVLNKKES